MTFALTRSRLLFRVENVEQLVQEFRAIDIVAQTVAHESVNDQGG